MLARFFIDRPIFAAVISIVITLSGGLGVIFLPIAQYPEIAPPTVQVSCTYPGASAQVVADTVAAPIEQQVNGVENMLYMSSQMTNDGAYNLTVTFKLGVNLDDAQVLVQNRVSQAMAQLPDVVKATGVTTKKKSPAILLVVNMVSPDGSRDQLYLSNYATTQIKDTLARVTGVGDVTFLGQQDFSMRLWLDPQQLASRQLSASDVLSAIKQQNVQVAAGQIGQPPVPAGSDFQYTVTALGRLNEPDQFASIILKTEAGGKIVRVKDVARVELGAKSQDQSSTLDERPSVGMAIFQLPGSNALATADSIRDTMDELKQRFPVGVDYKIVYDTTPFIKESMVEVVKTFVDALLLVAVVVLLFLQNWRATLIPLIAVPVAIVGTFAVMLAVGFSLNNISMFGLILAIGIVVDDAIVVVEAVEHKIEHGLAPLEATRLAMDEVTGPVIAVSLVLCAVFVPCAFITGITGEFFRQFALTIAVSTVISLLNSLTLSPALSAILLKSRRAGEIEPLPFYILGPFIGVVVARFGTPYVLALVQGGHGSHEAEGAHAAAVSVPAVYAAVFLVGTLAGALVTPVLNVVLIPFFQWFNAAFRVGADGYTVGVGGLLRIFLLVLLIFVALLGLTGYTMSTAPAGFIPDQDKGYLLVTVQLPDSASLERTQEVMKRAEKMVLATPGVIHTVAISGQSFLLSANGSNFGSMYVILDEFHNRHGADLSGPAIQKRLARELQDAIPDAQIAVFGAPPVDGLGSAAGFKLMIQDRADLGPQALQAEIDTLIAASRETPGVAGLFTMYRANTPQLFVDVDRTKCLAAGVPLEEVFTALQVNLGSQYVNDFNKFGRTWQVIVQADSRFRMDVDAVRQIRVRNKQGQMVALRTLARIDDSSGPVMIMRYNTYSAAAVNGGPAPGFSSGDAIARMSVLSREKLPGSMSFEWTEIAFLQLAAGNTAIIVFALAAVLVFLVLAAQYESWTLPLAIILVVPMCLLCAVLGVLAVGGDVNIFTQIGFVVLVGLAAKNAILIVEFAKASREKGMPVYEATLEACKLRLRPILMTSLAFILGVVPLVIAQGKGAEMRFALGIAVFSGMLGVTVFGLALTPVFYYSLQTLAESFGGPAVLDASHPHDAELAKAHG